MATVVNQLPGSGLSIGQSISAMMAQGNSFIPALGHLLYVKNRPFTEGLPPQLETLFSMELKTQSICKTGRQIGKCVSATSTVHLANGRPVCAADIRLGDQVLSMTDSLTSASGIVTDIMPSGKKKVLCIRTRMGSYFEVSPDHRLRTLLGYTAARDLRVGSRLAAVYSGGVFNNVPTPRDRVAFTAYMLGDGCCGLSGNFSFTTNADETLIEFTNIAKSLGVAYRTTGKQGTTAKAVSLSQSPNILKTWIEEDGCWGKYSYEKTIPAWVFDLSFDNTVYFISRLWATDGSLAAFRNVEYCSTSKVMATGVLALLRKLGISATIRRKESWCNGERKHDAFIIRVEGHRSTCRFLDLIKVPGKPVPAIPQCTSRNNRQTIPIEIQLVLQRLGKETAWKHTNSLLSNGLRNTLKYPLSQNKLQRYIEYFAHKAGEPDYTFLQNLQDADIIWDEVKEVYGGPKVETIDFEIATYHNFSLDGIVSHNSTSQAGRTIILSAAIPFFQTLTVTPQFEMTRRYSNNYIRPLISQSPISALLLDTTCENNVLQRTFANSSIMHFSFAFLDADRVRGLSIDRCHYDECSAELSSIQTIDGPKLIGKTLQKTDIILAHNESGNIVTDEIVDIVFKGTRPTYRIKLVDGRTMECTNNERIRTNLGWLYLQEIIDYGNQRRFQYEEQPRYWLHKTNATGNFTGGRLYAVAERRSPVPGKILYHSRVKAGGLLPPQSRCAERLCAHPTRYPEKRWLGGAELCLQHSDLAGLRILALPVLQAKPEDRSYDEVGDAGMGGSVGSGGAGLLVHGRRQHQHLAGLDHTEHSIVHQGVCAVAGEEDAHVWSQSHGTSIPAAWGQAEVLGDLPGSCGRQEVRRDCPSAHAREHGVQAGCTEQRLHGNGDMPVLRGSYSEGESSVGTHGILREAGVQSDQAQDHLCPGGQGPCKRACTYQLSEEHRTSSGVQPEHATDPVGGSRAPCTSERSKTGSPCCSRCVPGSSDDQMRLLRDRDTEGQPSGGNDGRLWQPGVQDNETPDYLSCIGRTLVEVEIESIEYAGDQRVWDVETKKHHTLFVNGFAVHNCQDIASEFIPEISRTMDRSKWRIEDFTGTPKTLDNIMEVLWSKSSQGEWLMPCPCGYTNNPSVDADGLAIIGDKTLICAKCKAALDATKGYWYHFKPEVRTTFVGWHVPQTIMPFHYQIPKNWRFIVAARNGEIPKKTFFNEILGESCDVGAKLISESDLRKSSLLPVKMDYHTARKLVIGYPFTALGVDWGGRGEDELSRTKAAVLGMRPDGRCDLLYAEDMSNLTDPGMEVARSMELFHDFNCKILAHDACGTAGMRDVLMNHARFPRKNIMPFSYVSAWSKDVISYHESNDRIKWPHYSLDKTRSLLLTIECIKHGFLFFPQWESMELYLRDFLGLIEEKVDTRRGSDTYLIRRAKGLCDDFAHAVNYCLMGVFHSNNRWPDLVNTIPAFTSKHLEELEGLNSDKPLSEWIRG